MPNRAKPIQLSRLVTYCDQLLQVSDLQDYSGAVNGLQVANRGQVSRIGAAVDASPRVLAMAVEAKCDLLVVHHGLFWGGSHPWTGKRYELLRLLLDHDLAVYSSHLPLDIHPRFGNNRLFCQALGWKTTQPFFMSHGRNLGLRVKTSIGREELKAKVTQALGNPPLVLSGGPTTCRSIGIVTGGAGGELKLAASEGIDTLITGEGPHWTFALAQELGVNVLYGGHYATETFGVKALASHLSRRCGVPWVFLDDPSGL